MKNLAILVPSYNSVSTLERTLKSILAQGESLDRYADFVMLSDDGSKDGTVALAQSCWAHPTLPLQIKRAAVNQGEYRNVNGAFAAMPAHIEWVLIMHADNEAMPGWLEDLARECHQATPNVATICGSWQYIVDDKLVEAGDLRGPSHVEMVEGCPLAIRNSIFKGCWWHNSAAAIRVSAWRSVGGHPQETPLLSPLEMTGLRRPPLQPTLKLRIKGDWDVMLRFLSAGWTIGYIGTPLIRYHEVGSSVSAGSFAWHGDLLETLQVMRRHQAAMSGLDIIRFHLRCGWTLFRRLSAAVLRRNWRRAALAMKAFPYVFASLAVSLLNHERGEGGMLKAIPFGPDQTAAQ